MKKIKLLPSLILLALCVAVLGIGIYAASPASNQITGTVTVNAANSPIKVQAFLGAVASDKPLTSEVSTRTSTTLDLNENRTTNPMVLNASEADDVDEVASVLVTFKITNLSTSKPLGVYFSDTEKSGAIASKSEVLRARTLDGATTAQTPVIKTNALGAVFTGYTQLPANDNITVTMRL